MSRSYRFGEFRINPALRELWHDERFIPLPTPVFDCLTYLLEHHTRAVGRDELVAAVWGKTEVSDTLLGQTILRIRRELGDDAREQRIIRTIPRFGYRWAAALDTEEPSPPPVAPAPTTKPPPVSIVEPSATREAIASPDVAEGAPQASVPAVVTRRATIVKMMLAAAALAFLIAAVWGLRLYKQTPVPAAVRGDAMVSAVLPAAVDPNSETEWMRLGMMEAVAAHLRSSGLPSVPSEDVVALLKVPAANRSGALRDVLAAKLLVTPHVQRAGDEWQIDLDADDGAGQRYSVDARSRDAPTAARAAADKLLAVLGKRPTGSKEESAEAVLLARLDAAALADHLDMARTLIAKASPEQQRSPEVRLRLAKIDYRGGNFDAARQRLIAMLDEAPAKTAPVLRASILNGLGSVSLATEQPEQAARYYDEAVPLLESRDEPEQLGQAYIGRAAAATDQGNYDAASIDYGRARIAYRQANDSLALIRVAADEGFVDYDRHRPARALPQLEAAAKGFTQWGALNEAILTYVYEIACHLALLDDRAAMEAADVAEELAQRSDNRQTLERLQLARARALAAVGRLQEARGVLDGLRSTAGVPAEIVASAGTVLAQTELDAGNATAAAALAERSVSIMSTPGHVRARADAWLIQVRAERRVDPAAAATTLAAFEAWVAGVSDAHAQVFAQLARAEWVRQNSAADWRQAFVEAAKLTEREASPFDIAAVARSYADALLAEGDLDAAAVEVGRVTRWSDQDFACAVLEARLYAATGRNDARQSAVARARSLAGERSIPPDALSAPVSTRAAAQ